MSEELKALKKEIEELKKAAMGGEVDEMIASAKEINEIKLVTRI